MDVAIRLAGLCRAFGSIQAVDELTLEIPAGSVFGFLGPNGAGKTTTIRLLLGLLEPSGGHAAVLGFDPWREGDEVRRRTGAVLEHTGVYEQLTAEENLEFYGRACRLGVDERRAAARELLGRMGLWERRHERPGTWSRGMQQRLALARALIHRPRLLFLDEPTAGLDVVVGKHPYKFNGRAQIVGETEGMVKVVAKKNPDGTPGQVLGVHMVGPWVTEQLVGGYLAVNWEATVDEVAELIQPHPSLTEVFGETMLSLTGRDFNG